MAKKSFLEKFAGSQSEEISYNDEAAELALASRVKTPRVQEDVLAEEEGQLTLDVYQTPSEVIIKSTIAGVDPNDLDISINNDMVTIRGTRHKDEEVDSEEYYYQELYWGSFSRSVILPVEVDADEAEASMKNGILTIKLPKLDKEKHRKLKVKNQG
ncbi:Hsp20/alpha crystallin family protein [Candidatus Parcubacteria bacterium]|nr:MAG: Hsp20/alpha crystallin family protein [Candidatus Parcubacteria bacterium]